MVSKVIVFFAALCLCQVYAKPAEGENNIETLVNSVTSTFESFNEEFKKVFKIPDNEESKKIADTLKTNANEFAGKLTEILGTINKEVKAHSGDAEKAVTTLKSKVEEAVKKLQDDHPVEAAKAKEYQQQIETVYNDIATKAKEAAAAIAKDTSGVQEDFHKFTERVMREVKTQADKINTELKKTLDEHDKEHKH